NVSHRAPLEFSAGITKERLTPYFEALSTLRIGVRNCDPIAGMTVDAATAIKKSPVPTVEDSIQRAARPNLAPDPEGTGAGWWVAVESGI
ncbi:MAG TPA: hypothetical protein VE074_07185, partial [Jatrophihabitantaceae bacterium]|nr:hypothetical protein [Jatrophihabitantaceae bacterium]